MFRKQRLRNETIDMKNYLKAEETDDLQMRDRSNKGKTELFTTSYFRSQVKQRIQRSFQLG